MPGDAMLDSLLHACASCTLLDSWRLRLVFLQIDLCLICSNTGRSRHRTAITCDPATLAGYAADGLLNKERCMPGPIMSICCSGDS